MWGISQIISAQQSSSSSSSPQCRRTDHLTSKTIPQLFSNSFTEYGRVKLSPLLEFGTRWNVPDYSLVEEIRTGEMPPTGSRGAGWRMPLQPPISSQLSDRLFIFTEFGRVVLYSSFHLLERGWRALSNGWAAWLLGSRRLCLISCMGTVRTVRPPYPQPSRKWLLYFYPFFTLSQRSTKSFCPGNP